jgi:hypothetical protein
MTSAAPTHDRLAEAVGLLAPHWPEEDRRHAAFLALAGGLLRDGLSVADVESLTEAVAEATGHDQTAQEVASVRTTAAKLKAGTAVTGWRRLLQLLGPGGGKAVGEFRRALGLTISLEDLAAYKRLPVAYLRGQGLHDLPGGGVGIPYKDAGGKTVAVKRRTARAAGDGNSA